MGKRGRPRHPDVLTPREWEVLGLVREGMSNEAISERLGISLDGVKYHVSEILGKLDVENRSEAARWQPEEARRRWWAVALAPLTFVRRVRLGWLSGAAAGGAAIAIAAGIGALIWALASTGGHHASAPANLTGLTAANFAERTRAAMGADGKVFHVVNQRYTEGGAGERQHGWTAEAWIDLKRNLAREEFQRDPSNNADLPQHVETVAIGDTVYSYDGESYAGPRDDCAGVEEFLGIALAFALGCGIGPRVAQGTPEPSPSAPTFDLNAQYRGTPAISYAITQDILDSGPNGDERTTTITTMYVDRATLLPLAGVMEADTPEGHVRVVDELDSELIDVDSLASDFFDPKSIGYVAPTPTPVIDPLDALQGAREAGVTPYWLGETVAADAPFVPLTFIAAERGQPPGGGPGYRIGMTYRAADAETGDVTIWLWTPQEWQLYYDEAVTKMIFLGRCGAQEEITTPAGTRATILKAHEPARLGPPATPARSTGSTGLAVTPTGSIACPDTFDLYTAIIDYGDTIVTINMPLCISCPGRGYALDPWDSRAGMLRLIDGLTVRK